MIKFLKTGLNFLKMKFCSEFTNLNFKGTVYLLLDTKVLDIWSSVTSKRSRLGLSKWLRQVRSPLPTVTRFGFYFELSHGHLPCFRKGHMPVKGNFLEEEDFIRFPQNSETLVLVFKGSVVWFQNAPVKMGREKNYFLLPSNLTPITKASNLPEILHRTFYFPWHAAFLFINP